MTYFFRCHWTNGKGSFDPDYEGCSYKSRPFKSLQQCVTKALKHDETHHWCGWGYAPLGWENKTTVIFRKSGKRETNLGFANNFPLRFKVRSSNRHATSR